MNRFESVKVASGLGIIGNLFLLIIKSIVGVISNSQAMMADCVNSAGDIFSSFMTFIGNKIASKPHDDNYNLGYGKAEYIYSMLISIVMMYMSLNVLKKSLFSIINNSKYEFSIYLVIVCVVTIITKFGLFLYTNKLAKKYDNLLIRANSLDHRNDCFITLSNLISCLFSLLDIYWIDGLVGFLISVWMFITGIKIFKESYNVLMDRSIDKDTQIKVYNNIKEHSEIKNVTHFNSTPVGYKYQISLSIFVDGNLTTFESHDIADKLEKEIVSKIDEIYLAVIHVNPIKFKDVKE